MTWYNHQVGCEIIAYGGISGYRRYRRHVEMEGQKSILPSMHPHKFCLCALKGLVSQHCYMCDLLSNMQ